MGVFHNRPLALAATLFCAILLLSAWLSSVVLFAVAGLGLLLFSLALLKLIRGGYRYRSLLLLLLALSLLLGGLRGGFSALAGENVEEKYLSETVCAELRVEEILTQSSYSGEVLVKVLEVDGEKEGFWAVVRAESALPLGVKDRIYGSFRVEALSFESDFDGTEQRYRGKGAAVLLIPEDVNAITLRESGTNSAAARLRLFRTRLSMRISSTVNWEAGELLSALLLGLREDLSPEITRDFRHIGVSHLLAISGLHLAILVGILERFLCLLGVGKRARICVSLPLLAFYAVLCGGSFSVIRAVCMFFLLEAAFLFKGENDPLTSLLLCASLILAISPAAMFDVSFQMTVLATLGLVTMGGLQVFVLRLLPRRKGLLRPLFGAIRFLCSSLLTTFCASFMILPVLWLTFGEISLLTPLSNLILVPLMAPVLLLGILTLCFPLPWIGACAGAAVKLLLSLVHALARIDATLFLGYDFVPYIFLPLFAVTLVLLIPDLKKLRFLVLSPALCAAVAFAICLCVTRAAGTAELRVLYRRSGENEGIVLLQNEGAVLCDISNGSYTQLRATYRLAREQGGMRIRALLLTHYHEKQLQSVKLFSRTVYLRELWVPQPVTERDHEVLAGLIGLSEAEGILLRVLVFGEMLETPVGAEILLREPLYEKRSTQPAFSLEISFGENTVCYHTAALSEFLRNAKQEESCRATHLLLGAHGPVPHTEIALPEEAPLCEVSLPSEEVLRLIRMRNGVRYYFYDNCIVFLLR